MEIKDAEAAIRKIKIAKYTLFGILAILLALILLMLIN
jgi:t-SNARE complex subunit (syntaxin)